MSESSCEAMRTRRVNNASKRPEISISKLEKAIVCNNTERRASSNPIALCTAEEKLLSSHVDTDFCVYAQALFIRIPLEIVSSDAHKDIPFLCMCLWRFSSIQSANLHKIFDMKFSLFKSSMSELEWEDTKKTWLGQWKLEKDQLENHKEISSIFDTLSLVEKQTATLLCRQLSTNRFLPTAFV